MTEDRFPPDDGFEDDIAVEPTEETPPSGPADSGIDFPWRLLLLLAIVFIIVVFAVQNTQDVELNFFAWSWELPLVFVILGAVAVSVLAESIIGGIVKRRRVRRRLEREELRRLRGET